MQLNSLLDDNLLSPQLDAEEKALRDLFVIEYLKDFNPMQACIRMGLLAMYAADYAERLMNESYVQSQIATAIRTQTLSDEEQVAQDKALIMACLRQAAQNGPYASRVQAAKQLAAMHGLDRIEADNGELQIIEAFKQVAAMTKKLDTTDNE